MLFSSPLWLWLLLPWSAVAVWLMWGRRDRVGVPFIDLWRGEVLQPRARRSFTPPPTSIVLILLAALLAILAAAGPSVRGLRSSTRVVVIVDRGITMSAGDADGSTRFATLTGNVWRDIAQALGHASVSLRTVPPLLPVDTDSHDWFGLTAEMPPTAVDTREAVATAVRQALNDGPDELVIVLSDENIAIKSDRVIQMAPEPLLDNVGIAHVAARSTPKPQVMVRIRNDSSATRVTLDVSSDAQRASQQIELPPRATFRDYFVDLPALSQSIEIAIVADALVADDRAWLVRSRVWPRVEARDALPPEVTRVIGAYQTSRYPSDDSPIVAVVSDASSLPATSAAIVVATGGGIIGANNVVAAVVDHPITRHVDWTLAVRGARLTEAPAGWTPVISVEGRSVVAVQNEPVRRVWMGIDSGELARSPQFAIFWTDALDWLGAANSQDANEFEYETVTGAIGDEWQPRSPMPTPHPRNSEWPGLYVRTGDGALRAINAPIVELPTTRPDAEPGSWRDSLRHWSRQRDRTELASLASPLIIAGIALLVLSAMRWGQHRRAMSAISDKP